MSEAVKRLKANRLIAGKRCGWCRSPLVMGEDAAICGDCRLLHHDACWEERGGCAREGCVNAPLPQVEEAAIPMAPRPRSAGRRGRVASRYAGETFQRRIGRARKSLIALGVLVLLSMGCQMSKISREQRQYESMRYSRMYDVTPERREMVERYLSVQRTTSVVMGLLGVTYLVLGIAAASAPFGVCLTGAILLGLQLLLTVLGLFLGGSGGPGGGAAVLMALVLLSLMGLALAFVIGGARAAHELKRAR